MNGRIFEAADRFGTRWRSVRTVDTRAAQLERMQRAVGLEAAEPRCRVCTMTDDVDAVLRRFEDPEVQTEREHQRGASSTGVTRIAEMQTSLRKLG